MFTFLLVILVIDALILIPVVLLQSGKGGGLAAMGGGAGTDTLFGSRQATTILTKATWWTAGIFVGLAFVLSILSSRPQGGGSVLRQGLQQSAPVPTQSQAPAIPGVNRPQAAPPAAPAAQAPVPAATQGGNDPATSAPAQPAAPRP